MVLLSREHLAVSVDISDSHNWGMLNLVEARGSAKLLQYPGQDPPQRVIGPRVNSAKVEETCIRK